MTAYFRCSGSLGAELVTDMNTAFDEAFNTSGGSYPVNEWADLTNLLGPIPIKTKQDYEGVIQFSDSLAKPLKSYTGTLASRVNTNEISGFSINVQHGADDDNFTFYLNRAIVGGEVDFINGVVNHPYFRGPITTVKLTIPNGPNASGLIFISWAFAGLYPVKAEGITNVRSNLFPTSQTRIEQDASVEGISGDSGVGMRLAIEASKLSGDLTTSEGRIAAFRQWAEDNGLVVDYEGKNTPVSFTPLTDELDTVQGYNAYTGLGVGYWDSFELQYYFDISTL